MKNDDLTLQRDFFKAKFFQLVPVIAKKLFDQSAWNFYTLFSIYIAIAGAEEI